MKAYELANFGLDELRLADAEVPEPGDDEVLVKMHAASLNYRDLMVVSGKYNPRMKLPVVPLSDGAGEIVAVGRNVRTRKPGDRVMPLFVQKWFDGKLDVAASRSSLGGDARSNGVLREYAAFNERSVVEIPGYLSSVEAATLPCTALTAWHALVESGGLQPGEVVLTQGTGGVSIFAIQIAKHFGAKVIATSSSDAKIDKLRELGVDLAINYAETPDWEKAVLEFTDGVGVDHVVEVGGAGTIQKSIASVRMGGNIALIGALSGAASVDTVPIFMRAIRLQGVFVGSKAMFERMLAEFATAELRPVIDRTFAFPEAREAFRYMERGEHFGKIVIEFPLA
ncbi:MAG: NADPH:quinone reductase-like Zn-dependent oxidoreductase [Acidobacteria bacterium OLB17]|nr:MAG: NADPH:quinone reductase-like Zn-dependent oxidoreductase [Acidobacteria bacterium OLB17]MCZ2391758.1 NAD(P)-dependent alcohol dehydrogenase [Acidobacteriota bacterium]